VDASSAEARIDGEPARAPAATARVSCSALDRGVFTAAVNDRAMR
jgi:hypothetical protein